MVRPVQLTPLRDILIQYDLISNKSLGQHFLLDQNLTNRIAKVAGDSKTKLSNFTVVEIGAGPGGLTRSILEHNPKHLFAIERDTRCVEILNKLRDFYPKQLTIIPGNALNSSGTNLGQMPRRIIANLPYNISTILLITWLKRIDDINQMTLMFQKEVADRIIAKPSTKAYGRLSVITQWLCEAKLEFHINKRAFMPPPKVRSSLVTLKPRPTPLHPAQFKNMEIVTSAAFGQRRKMLRSSLKSLDIDFESIGIDQKARAENLTIEEFSLLAQVLKERSFD